MLTFSTNAARFLWEIELCTACSALYQRAIATPASAGITIHQTRPARGAAVRVEVSGSVAILELSRTVTHKYQAEQRKIKAAAVGEGAMTACIDISRINCTCIRP